MKNFVTMLLCILLVSLTSFKDKKAIRVAMLDKVFATLEKNIANPKWLEVSSFKSFKKRLYSNKVLTLSEKEFRKTFDKERKKLPFSHFQILKKDTNMKSNDGSLKENTPAVFWEVIDNKTAYLKITTFSISETPVVKALQEIGVNKYKNLIIDLRDNEGGNLEGPLAIGRFLTNKPIDAGYYLTRKWFDTHENLPTQTAIQKMILLKDFTNLGISKAFAETAAFRMLILGHDKPIFKGKVYVLINKWTASAGEPLIDLLKKEQLATLVGETSNGSMLSGKFYNINKNYSAFIPIADYYTRDGFKIDKVGVQPDIHVNSAVAKAYALKLINNKK
jgi:C-terminal processing protease CtpA/Prc